MQFKNILATICAFSVAGTLAGPVPAVEGAEIVERSAGTVDATILHLMAQDAATKATSTTGSPPTEKDIKDLITKVNGLHKRDLEGESEGIEKRWYYGGVWDNSLWARYYYNYNNVDYTYWCWTYGYNYCYTLQYNQYYNTNYWYGLNNRYYYPVNSLYNNGWNYYGYDW